MAKTAVKVKQEAQTDTAKPTKMKEGWAYYVPSPSVEIYIFVNEEPTGLPDNAIPIIERTTSVKDLLDAVEPYFILGSGQ